MTVISNPWHALPSEPPFVLPEDRAILEEFNRRAGLKARVETDLLPEPYVGRLDAPVVLLLLNPGIGGGEFALHQNADFRDRVLRCHRQEAAPYPNYYLDPVVTGDGARWNTRITRRLTAEFGTPAVAAGVAFLEYFPYHSRNFVHHRLRVPSQQFTLDLLRSALSRDAVIFITRGRTIWQAALPELRGYPRAFSTRSVQNVVISPGNCPEGYEAARAALERAARAEKLEK